MARAPAQLRAALEFVARAGQELLEQEREDESEAMTDFFELISDPEYLAAFQVIADFAVEECGLDLREFELPDWQPEDFSDHSGDFSSGGDFVLVGDIQTNLRENYDRPHWMGNISMWSSTNGLVVIALSEVLDSDTTIEICSTISEIVYDLGDASIEIQIAGPEGEILASRREADSVCAAS